MRRQRLWWHDSLTRDVWRMKKLICSLLVILLLTPALFAAKDPEWVEVRSPNFTVITDAGPKKGREVALRFEQLRAVFGSLLSKVNVNTPVPLQILAFKRKKDFEQIAPLYNGKPIKLAGLYISGGDRNFIALDLSQPDPMRVVYHEYAHMLLDANFPRTQPWFDEGFAGYYESLEVSGKKATVGKDPGHYGELLTANRFMPLADLFAVTQESRDYNEGDRRGIFYAQSWLTVHYLLDTKKMPQASRYLGLVLKEKVSIPEAIQQAFGMSPKELDRDLQDYFRSSRALYYTLDTPAGLSELSFEPKAIDPWDARAALAEMRLRHRDYMEAAAEDFNAILAAKPDHAAAHRGLGYHFLRKQQFATAAQHFRKAAAGDLSDPQVLYYLGMLGPVSGDTGPQMIAEMKQALRKAVTLKPDFADAYNLLAFAHGAEQDWGAAADAMRQAVKLAPREEKYADGLARYLMRLEQWDEAEPIWRTLSTSQDAGLAAGAQQQLEFLTDVRARKARSAAGPKVLALRPSAPVREEARATAAATAVPEPVEFLKGTLLDVTCPAETVGAVLRVQAQSRIWTMLVPDRDQSVIIGADALDCAWKQRKVAINYRKKGDAGEVVSLEISRD